MARVSLIIFVAVVCMAQGMAVSGQGFNITTVLKSYPQYGLFNEWLSLTDVAREINARTGITVLATTNTSFQAYLSGVTDPSVEPGFSQVIDALRYQILLTYYGIVELQKISLNNFTEVTTLLQTTGRTNGSDGFVDIYHVNGTATTEFVVGPFQPDGVSNETVISNVTESPFAYSILELSSFLLPPQTTSLSPLPSPTIAPAPFSGASPPAPPPPTVVTPSGGSPTTTPTKSYSSIISAGLPSTLVALFLACVAGLV